MSCVGFAEIWARIHGAIDRFFQGGGLVASSVVIHGGDPYVDSPTESDAGARPGSNGELRNGTLGVAPKDFEGSEDPGAAPPRQVPGKVGSSSWGEPGFRGDRAVSNGPGKAAPGLSAEATTGGNGRSGEGRLAFGLPDLPGFDSVFLEPGGVESGEPERRTSGGRGSRVEGPGWDGGVGRGVADRPRRGRTGGAPWWGAGVASRAWDEVRGADLARLFHEGARVELDRIRGTSTAVDLHHLVGRKPSWGLGQGLRQRASELRADLRHHGQVLLGRGGYLLEALANGRRPQGTGGELEYRAPASSWARVALALRDSSSTRLELGAALLEEGHLEACRWILGGLLVEEVPRVIRRRAHRGRALAWERDGEWERARASWSAAAFLGDEPPCEGGSGLESGSISGSTLGAHRRELIESREDWRACMRLAWRAGDAREAEACRKELDRIAAGL